MRTIHFADSSGRDSHVAFVTVKPPAPPLRVANGKLVAMRRFILAGDINTHEALAARHGTDYGAALIDSDPEVDFELTGRPVASTSVVYLDGDGEVLQIAPEIVEAVYGPDGAEKERRSPQDKPANIDVEIPLRFTKNRMKRGDAVRRFAFSRTVQFWHTDGLTYDFLHGLAKSLDEADEMVLLGGGESGRDPIVFQLNGLPWRGFLEGRVEGPKYQLLLRLSNLELKKAVEAL
jgi:hypothetical protein